MNLFRSVLVVVVSLHFVPGAWAEVDPRIHADAAECLEALGIDLNAAGELDTTCVVAYAHVAPDWRGLDSPILTVQRPPDDIVHHEVGFFHPGLAPYWDLDRMSMLLYAGQFEYEEDRIVRPVEVAHVQVLESAPWFLKVYLTADQASGPRLYEGAPDPVDAGVIPCLHLVATLETVREEPQVVAQNQTVVHVARPGTEAPALPCVEDQDFSSDENGITEARIELAPTVFNGDAPRRLWIDVAAYALATDGTRYTPPGVRWVHGPDHVPFVTIPTPSPIRVTSIEPLWYNDVLYYRSNITSPWGHQDVHLDALDLQIMDPLGRTVSARSLGSVLLQDEPIVYNGHRIQPHPATFAMDVLAADLPDGTYVARVIAENSQHTAITSAETTFTLADGGSRLTLRDLDGNVTGTFTIASTEEAPFFAPTFTLTTLGLLLAMLRRRQ